MITCKIGGDCDDGEGRCRAQRRRRKEAFVLFSMACTMAACLFSQQASAGIICSGANCSIDPISVGSNGGGDGSLTIDSGSVLIATEEARFGSAGPDQGDLTVTNAGSSLGTVGRFLSFGGSGGGGQSNVTIRDGGNLTFNSLNTIAPTDQGIFFGLGGSATVNVSSGGSIAAIGGSGTTNASTFIIVGSTDLSDHPSQGVLSVDGEGSRVDILGNGSLAVLNLGESSNDNSSPAASRGVLNVTNGADVLIDGGVSAGFISLARGGNSDGELSVSGAGSSVIVTGDHGSIFITNDFQNAFGDGNARVTVADDAQLNVTGSDGLLIVGFGSGNGSLTVESGGKVAVDGFFGVSTNSPRNSSQTGIAIINGADSMISATTTVVGNGTDPAINGILAGTGTLMSDFVVIQTGGLLDPGLSPGVLSIIGDLSFDGGMLRIEVGGVGQGQFDFLDVTGSADFADAIIEFAFIDGFLPSAADVWDFVSASTIVGLANASFSFTGLAEGFLFDVGSVNNSLRFSAMNAGVAVPEPGSLALLCSGLVALSLVRRRALGRRADGRYRLQGGHRAGQVAGRRRA